MGELLEQSSNTLPPETVQQLRQRALSSLYFFCKGILGYDRLVPHVHGLLCSYLENPEKRHRLKVTLPRGWYKSTVCSIGYPIWRALQNPDIRILLAQNTFNNAVAKLGAIKTQIEKNELLRSLFPEILPDKDCTWIKDKLQLRRANANPEATFEAAGMNTAVISRHYNLIIEDDTVAPDLSDLGEENIAPSKDDIVQAIGWHRLVPPLLTDIQHDEILVVGTRWFEKDLLSWIDENESYTSYTRACREKDGIPAEDGRPAFIERFDEPVLAELEKAMGPYMFSCLYMNKPVRSGDMLFQLDWFKYYDELPRDIVYYTSVDPAGDPEDTKGEPDYNVVCTCAKDLITGNVFLVDYFRQKCSPGDLLEAFFNHVSTYKPIRAAIETVAYQKSLLYYIRQKMADTGQYVHIDPITHGRRAKNARIMGLQPLVKAGLFKLRHHHAAFVKEALSFPVGKNDDLLDAVSMQQGLWNLTRSKHEEKQELADDVFDPMTAVRGFRKGHRGNNSSLDLLDNAEKNNPKYKADPRDLDEARNRLKNLGILV